LDAKEELISLKDDQKCKIFELLEYDVNFLRRYGLMDYSFLLIITKSTKACSANSYLNINGDRAYYISIIDYLQKFDAMKKWENLFKKIQHQSKIDQISCIEPGAYANRFLNFMRNTTLNIKFKKSEAPLS
jgi:hypothetical protein